MKYSIRVIVLFTLFIILFCVPSCEYGSTEPSKGTVVVFVIDNLRDEPPLPNISITIVPGDIIQQTDINGKCSFELDPGDYYVDADICCMGPGYISYHEPVTITPDHTSEIVLMACSVCL